jgi:RNA polymerase subunit RPABC4/transcription elongation factor Spt4
MTEHPAKCPICLAFWDFQTDWLGQVMAIHPVTRCIAPAPAIVVEEDESWERRCIECHEIFSPPHSRAQAKICSARCRKCRALRVQNLARKSYQKQSQRKRKAA